MSLNALLAHWRADPNVGGNVVEWRTLPARSAQYVPFPAGLHPALITSLQTQGIQGLYTHQLQAWEASARDENVVIVTGTASGKTLGYNLPVLDRLMRDPEARALYLFPTKALAQDQLAGLKGLDRAGEILAGIFDGDTPAAQRPTIRTTARLVLSNPDMLHTGIMPRHTSWASFFHGLRFVVIDEMHSYRGVFGSHVANVMRRLKRIAQHYGSRPIFILTSATIGNPAELATRLIEAPVTVIDQDGSGRGPKHFLIYNPPVVDRSLGLRRSALQESVRLTDDLLREGVQTIVFAGTRRRVEIMLRALQAKPRSRDLSPDGIQGYRSGYLPSQRRLIEQGLRDGSVQAVVATNALELGIDIGGMGAVVMAGYPGTIAGAWQQAGRSGRGEQPSLSMLVASPNPLDQFLARHPEYFFGRSPEQALIDPNHLLILLDHLRCAAYELPFSTQNAPSRAAGFARDTTASFGQAPPEQIEALLDFLHQEGVVHPKAGRYFWMAEQYPAQDVSLRSAGAENVVLQVFPSGAPGSADESAELESTARPFTLGVVDIPSAPWMIHPGAIYLHQGQSYLVETLNLETHQARLAAVETDYTTEPRQESTVARLQTLGQAPAPGGEKFYGEIIVTNQVVGYRKVRADNGAGALTGGEAARLPGLPRLTIDNLGFEPLELPPSRLQTTGYWLALSETTVDRLQADGLWSNAPNKYGAGWPKLVQQVRARDGYACQICGALETERAHDVHHKIPFRLFDTAEEANRLENLVTLCHACHRKAEMAVRVRSGLAGLGFVLGQLAPLFLMCDGRDLGVLSDPQSPLADGKPAVVIYDQAPGGIGFSARLFELHTELAQRGRELVSACDCDDGCPSCVGPGGEGGSGGKREALAILESLAEEKQSQANILPRK